MKLSSKVKRVNDHSMNVEIKQLENIIVLVVESEDLLNQLDCKSIAEFEFKINEKSGFTNAMLSATAYGKDIEYKRLLELESLIDGRLSFNDLNTKKQLKKSVTDAIKQKHTEYFTYEELKTKSKLDEIIKLFNSLTYEERVQVGINRQSELSYNLYSKLR